jgi:glycerophosphoryl diester phosphodiesterase
MKTTFLLALAAAMAFPAGAVELQGHRGARGLAPENTLPAFRKALALGVDTLELDTGVTRDGVLVITHDPSLNPDITRGADGKFLEARGPAIRSLSYAQLRRYDVGRLKPGTEYAKRYPEQVAADGTRVPRLTDLFDLVKKARNTTVRFNIEIKSSPEKPDETIDPEAWARLLATAIRKAGLAGRATIQSFDWRGLQVVQKEFPEIPTVYLTIQRKSLDTIGTYREEGKPAEPPKPSIWTAGFQYADHGSVPKMVKAAGGTIWSPFHGDVNEASLKEAHDLGLKVVVWTPNEPAQIERALALGVDGIITDRPDVAKKLIGVRP